MFIYICLCVGVVVSVGVVVTKELCRSDVSVLWFLSEMVECLINLKQCSHGITP